MVTSPFSCRFKAGLACVRHMPAESFLDTSMKMVLIPSSKEAFLEKDTYWLIF